MQVLLNLFSNAVKYNRPAGRVSVASELHPDDAGGRLRIGIRDTGAGIVPERMSELFIPFSRLGAERSVVEGTGLGLALSKRLMEAMGGQLYAESTPGEGSTFWVELPLASSPVDDLQRTGKFIAQNSGGLRAGARRAALLYMEDDLANLDLIEAILALRPDLTLIPALQGQLGLDLGREHQPDLILLDLHLPDMSGTEVLHQLKADPRSRDVPVVMISADAYLTKPLDVDQFLEVIDRLLGAAGASYSGDPEAAEQVGHAASSAGAPVPRGDG